MGSKQSSSKVSIAKSPSSNEPQSLIKEYFPDNVKLKRVSNFNNFNDKFNEEKMIRLKKYKLSPMGSLEEYLPEEIMLQILDYLPICSLIKLKRVSRNFKEFWSEFPILWKKFQVRNIMYIPLVRDDFKFKLLESFEKYGTFGRSLGLQFFLLGEKECGKTIYQSRAFNEDVFSYEYSGTIGAEFFKKKVCSHLQINSWAVRGEERHLGIIRSMYNGIHFYLFDLNNHDSFERAKQLFHNWKQSCEILENENFSQFLERKNFFFSLLGMKSDLRHEVSRDEIHEFLEQLEPEESKTLHTSRVQYFELSSKNDSISELLFPYLYTASILLSNHWLNH